MLRRKLWARVLELWLFGEEPSLAFSSLIGIVKINALLVAHVLLPLLIAAPVVALLVLPLNDFYARTPLQNGGTAVLTVRSRSLDAVKLTAPSWIQVDAPPVRVPADREISWRLRATAANRGVCKVSVAGETVTKDLDAPVRSRAWWESLLHPAEQRLPEGPIERIWISQAPGLDWQEWFAGAASITAWLFSVPLGRSSLRLASSLKESVKR